MIIIILFRPTPVTGNNKLPQENKQKSHLKLLSSRFWEAAILFLECGQIAIENKLYVGSLLYKLFNKMYGPIVSNTCHV